MSQKPTSIPKTLRPAIAAALRRAFAGRLQWLHDAAAAAGYRRRDDWTVRSATEAAAFCGVNRKTLEKWIRADGCPGKLDGVYDLRAISAWRAGALPAGRQGKKVCRQAGLAENAGGGNGDGFAGGDAREELYHWKARRARLDYHKLRGDLVTRDVHERELHRRSSYFVRVLESLPALLGQKLARVRGVAGIRRVVRDVCETVLARAYGVEGEGKGTEPCRQAGQEADFVKVNT